MLFVLKINAYLRFGIYLGRPLLIVGYLKS